MKKVSKYIITLVAIFIVTSAFSQKPKWVGNTPREQNYTYKFVEVVSYGDDYEGARANALERLAGDQLLTEGVRIYQKTVSKSEKDKIQTLDQPMQYKKHTHTTVTTEIDGQPMELSALRIDEYIKNENGRVMMHTLFQVATCDTPVFDNVYLTTKYGFSARALVPGWAQLYKGSTAKGLTILAAEVAAIGGVIFTENERATYESKMRSQPNFARQYKTKVDNYETARNCCIGAAAAIYVYNLIDAIVAPGARRVVVKPRNLQFAPVASKDFSGVTLSYNF